MADRITRRLFAGNSTVILEADTEDLPIPAEDVPHFVGAIDGSVVTVRREDEITYEFTTAHPWLSDPMIRTLYWDADGALRCIFNKQFFLRGNKQRKGYGIHSVALELVTAKHYGIKEVYCMAAGGPGRPEIGYYTWPLFGFDANLNAQDIANLPAELAHCRTLNDLMLNPGGDAHWRARGHSEFVTFSFAPESRCWDILMAYLERNGVEL